MALPTFFAVSYAVIEISQLSSLASSPAMPLIYAHMATFSIKAASFEAQMPAKMPLHASFSSKLKMVFCVLMCGVSE